MTRLVLALVLTVASFVEPASDARTAVFVGSTPCNGALRALLDIPRAENAELIEWELSLSDTGEPSTSGNYDLRFKFGKTRPNQPGLDADASKRERRGRWKREAASRQPATTVVALDNGLSLLRVGDTILHLLEANRSLMAGNGGWSYTLSRRDVSERHPDAAVAAADPGDPPRTTSRATGPSLLAIFDGRTPCQGIARELGIAARPGCSKAKWRLTLFHDPNSHEPTTYRLEGTLYRSQPREGSWRITRGIPGLPGADVYELGSGNGEPQALLLKGDERVLFFLGRDRLPLTGNATNAYTLDRVSGR